MPGIWFQYVISTDCEQGSHYTNFIAKATEAQKGRTMDSKSLTTARIIDKMSMSLRVPQTPAGTLGSRDSRA